MFMEKIPTRKTVTLAMAAAYIAFTAWSMLSGVKIPDGFDALATLTIGYHYGKSTAQDQKRVD